MHDFVWASPSPSPSCVSVGILEGAAPFPPAPPLTFPPICPSIHTRWDAGGAAFSRPVRWLLALHGAATVPFASMGLVSSSATRLLRNAPQPEMQVQS